MCKKSLSLKILYSRSLQKSVGTLFATSTRLLQFGGFALRGPSGGELEIAAARLL